MKRRRATLLIVAGLALGLAGCPRGIDKPLIDTGIFSHTEHLGDAPKAQNNGERLGCQDCHEVDQANDYLVLRPGRTAHAPCDTCHADKYYQEPGEFCAVCHTQVDPLHPGASPVHDYPRLQVAAQLVSTFNHRVHLEGKRVTNSDGAALDCQQCHSVPTPDAKNATFPKHKNCVQCHGSAVSPRLSDCNGCHSRNGPGRARSFIKNDIIFHHGKHLADNAGKISCETCHYAVKKSTSQKQLNLPQMADCAKCHEDSARTPDRVRISNCAVCHSTDVEARPVPANHGVGAELSRDELTEILAILDELDPILPASALADISGLVPQVKDMTESQKPENHTIFFRVNHSQAASSKDAKCGYCHTGLSGSPRDSCNDCHSTWKPRDHSLRWKTSQHGRQFAVTPQRCATCHEVDFCTSCHSVPPPNHSPLSVFRYRHGRVARFNVRACVTCHTFETTCVECHTQTIFPIRDLK
jgi:hypothetical protein